MSDVVEQILDAVKEIAHDVQDKVGAAVKEALHVPDNMAPMLQTMKDLVATGQKFAGGEGSKEELANLTVKLASFSSMVDGLVRLFSISAASSSQHTHQPTHLPKPTGERPPQEDGDGPT